MPAEVVVALAVALVDRQRWVAYELVYHHPGGPGSLGVEEVERLGRGMEDWGSVDAFGCSISGPAWQKGSLPDAVVRRWAASPDRWWRRAALVSTVPLNLRSRGGTGDTRRTLDICARLAADRDDELASRVRREVRNKPETGRKSGEVRT